jgi:succinyl-diaminopimelate desuccinylase
MNGEISELIERNLSEAVAAVQAQIKIPSVKAAPLPNMPFGQPIANALEHMLALGQKLGFTTRNVDGHVGVVEYGTGEEMLGIFCHLDVVPEGMGWTYPPFGAEIHQGRIYGRGAMDNKGPAICTLYALAAIKEADLPLKRRVQVLFGCDEESGWDCMRHYSKVEKLPDIGFSPDAEYPLAYAEKGIIQAYFKKKYASKIKIESGSRVNVIPGEAVAWVPIDASAVGSTDNIRVQADGKMTRITAIGVGGHAAHPENATNAMLILLQTLATLPLEGEDKATVQFLADTLRLDNYGESAGLSYADASGRLTLSPGILQCDHEGLKLALDLRHPVAQKTDKVLVPGTSTARRTCSQNRRRTGKIG